MDGLAKWYYLVQFAFWLQQIVVVNIEERRKDHWQMFTHHIITCTLIFLSYGYHQTRVGNVILCLMDIVDIFFPLAKIFKYLGFKLLPDITFGVFMVTWFITRHVLYSMVCWSIYADIPRIIEYGCYYGSTSDLHGPIVPNDWDHLIQPFRDPEGLVCWNNNTKWTFLFLLGALQIVLLVWFTMILKVAWKVINGGEADDIRSDDEDSEVEEDILTPNESSEKENVLWNEGTIEEDADGDTVRLSSPARQGRASPARILRRSNEGHAATTGVSLKAHSDRKELLGRIGCDKNS